MAKKWIADAAHTEIEFKVKHLMISTLKGTFDKFEITADGDDILKSTITVKIDSSSVNTNNTDRDNHLKNADFFNAEKFPEIIFKSKSLEIKDSNESKLTGDLTILNVTKEIVLNVEHGGEMKDPWGNVKQGFSVSGKINRKDFGLTWNAALEAGGVMVSDEVKINAEVQMIEQA